MEVPPLCQVTGTGGTGQTQVRPVLVFSHWNGIVDVVDAPALVVRVALAVADEAGVRSERSDVSNAVRMLSPSS